MRVSGGVRRDESEHQDKYGYFHAFTV
jgi:hypothetical protein